VPNQPKMPPKKSRLAVFKSQLAPTVADRDVALRVAAVNGVAWFGLCMTVLMSAIEAILGEWAVALGNQTSTLAFGMILLLSRAGRHMAARIGLLIFIQILIIFYSRLFGSEIGLKYFFYSLLTLPFVLFGTKEKGAIVFSCLLAIGGGIFLELQTEAWRVGRLPLEADVQKIMQFTYWVASLAGVAMPALLLFILTERFRSKLRDEQAMLVQSAKLSSLGEMAAGIAHEINNPLAIIVGKVEQTARLVRDTNPPDLDKISGNLSLIEATGQRIAKIVKGLRAFSRDATGDQMEVAFARDVVSDALALTQERLLNNGVELRFRCESNAQLLCRPTQISQIVVNLVMNAFDAVVGTQSPWVEVMVEDNDGALVLSVTDSGAGISANIADKIMQPFFTTKEVGKGTGLGLSISKGIAQGHGGELYYDSTSPNTRFVLRLPAKSDTYLRSAA
jgi:signal transduction histidine kinase